MDNGIAVTINDVSKKFRIYSKPSDKLKESLLWTILRKKWEFHRDFWALKDINIEIPKGLTIGIMGQNGSGKSTLLQIIAGILQPTTGSINVNGRVSALLELGTGFNPEFSGRENVFMQGTIMGISRKEMEERFSEIAAFADIDEFINQPVKIYSSGMYVRLAFATAINVNPDILIIDEALAVGDIRFQAKCFRKFKEFQENKKTIIFVTQSPDLIVKHCDKAIILHEGVKLSEGSPKDISNEYIELLLGGGKYSKKDKNEQAEIKKLKGINLIDIDNELILNKENEELTNFINNQCINDKYSLRNSYNLNEYRWGNGSALILDYLIVSGNRIYPVECDSNEMLSIYMKVFFKNQVAKPVFGFYIKTIDGVTIYGINSRDYDKRFNYIKHDLGNCSVVCFKLKPKLATGYCMISLGVSEDTNNELIQLDRRYDSIIINIVNSNLFIGMVDLESSFKLVSSKS